MTTPDQCGDIRRTEHARWVCICPRDNHPLNTQGGLSHYYVNTTPDHD